MRLETRLDELKTASALCLRCMVCTYGQWPANQPLCALYQNHRTYTGSPGGLIYLIKALSEKWTDYTAEIAQLAYECTLCESCDICEIIPMPPPHASPSDLIRLLRHISIKNDLAPGKIRQLQTKLKKDGLLEKKISLKTQDGSSKIPKTILFTDGKSNTEKEMLKHASSLLKKMHLNAAILDCSGARWADLYDLGFWDELKQVIDANADEMAALNGKEVIFLNPHAQQFITKEYREVSSSSIAIKTRHFSELLRQALKKGKIKPVKDKTIKVAYHDPCRLSRGLGIDAAPRDVLKLINVEIIEMNRNRRETYCCGAGAVNPAFGTFSRRVAEERIRDFLETEADILVTACPNCQEVFSGLLGKEKGKVKDLIELVDERTEKL